MKKLYHIAKITLICTFVFTLAARERSSARKEMTPSSPISTIKTYKQLRDDIAAMKSDMVVAPDGIFTDYFINFIKDNAEKSQLPDAFTKALLEAGMSFHASLSEDNQFMARVLKRNAQHIHDIMHSLKPAAAKEQLPKQKDIPATRTEPTQQQPINTKNPSSQPIPSKPKNPQSEPSIQPTPQKPQPKPIEYKKDLSGPAGLKEFRKQSINKPFEAFYANAQVNQEWLKKAFQILLNGQPLTSKNKKQIQHELIGNATELMRELLHINKIAGTLWSIFIENVEKQTIGFMDNQPLSDQKQKPHTEPVASNPKAPTSEPQKIPHSPDKDPHLPAWITSQNTLIIKELETEALQFIFKNQDASQEDIAQHFIKQVPKSIKTREILINGIKATIGKILQEPLGPDLTPEAPHQKASSKNKLPYWIDPQGFNVRPADLDKEIARFIASNMDADNEAIANHFINLIPHDMLRKKLLESQIRATIEDFLAR